MPVFDSPITANDVSLDRVLAQPLPVVLTLFSQRDQSLQATLERLASEHAGKVLIVRINADENPQSLHRFGTPQLPAVITLKEGTEAVRSEAASPPDLEAHTKFVLGQGPKPTANKPPEPQTHTAEGVTSRPVAITDATFEREVLQSAIPVVVDFWAPWCGPCHMIAPVLDRLAQTYAGRVKIAKLNVDENPAISRQYQISGIPHLILFKSGQLTDRLVGAHPQQNIERMIAPHI